MEKVPWKPDDTVNQCENCAKVFSVVRRKHHCRECGGVFCNACCGDFKRGIPGYGDSPQRQCIVCKDSCVAVVNGGSSHHPRERKICLLGLPGVGKTAIFQQFMNKEYTAQYQPTITTSGSKVIRYKGVEYALSIIDTAGQGTSDLFQPTLTIGTKVFILVYSIIDRSSLQMVVSLHEKIIECAAHDAIMMLVGTKADVSKAQREVTFQDGEKIATKLGVNHFCELSARKPQQVENLFNVVLREIVARE